MKPKHLIPLLLCLLLCGCKSPAVLPEPTPNTEMLENAFHQQASSDEMAIRLYFRYQDSAYLSAEDRELMVSRSETPEKAVVQALLDGPSADSVSLQGLFPPGTEILSTAKTEDGTLFLTFNEALLGRYADESGGVGNTEYILRRKLCTAALANTLTEGGFCTKVQILVKRETSAVTSLRLPASFYRDTEDETPLGLISRDESVILTPHNTAQCILDAWMRRSNDTLYAYIAAHSSDASPRPGTQEAYAAFDQAPLLSHFSLSSGVVSADGRTAVLCADMVLRIQEKDVHVEGYPLRLVLENDLWKIQFDQLTGLFNAR